MKTLNQRRAQILKTEKIAVLNEGGNVDELNDILKKAFPEDTFRSDLKMVYFYSERGVYYSASNELPDGYTAHPISWFYEQDEAEAPHPESEIIGWELGIDVPEFDVKKGFKTYEVNSKWGTFNEFNLPKSVLHSIAKPIYKRTTAAILDDLMKGRISKDEAVKELELKTKNMEWISVNDRLPELREGEVSEAVQPQPTDSTRRSEIVQLVAAMIQNSGYLYKDIVPQAILIQSEIDQQLSNKDWSKSCPCGDASTGETWCCNLCGLPKIDKVWG